MMTSVSSPSPTSTSEDAAPTEARRPGRPRDARADRAILDATLELVAAEGLDGFSVDAVAQKAGVSKATIYRRWTSKEQMVLDAFHEKVEPMTTPDTGSLRGDVEQLFDDICSGMHESEKAAALIIQVLAAARSKPELEATLQETLNVRRRPLRELLERAQARGEVSADLDLDIAMDLLTGPMFFRFLISGAAVDEPFLTCLRDVVLAGLEKPKPV
jgi:AcrR family transcriptional regulator